MGHGAGPMNLVALLKEVVMPDMEMVVRPEAAGPGTS